MKTVISIVLALAIIISVDAQSDGIEFANYNWEMALKEAKEQDKLIFVDCYTSWCGPCKWMASEVFPQKAVGDFYNENFVNVKLDMEKGEGILFAKAYGIRAYPTLMFIDANGNMVHKGLGGRDADQFLALGESATDENMQLGSLQMKYEKEEKSPELLKNYTLALKEAGDNTSGEMAMEYLKGQTDWKTSENLDFIMTVAPYDMSHPLFEYVANNRSDFYGLRSQKEVDGYMKNVISYSMRRQKGGEQEVAAAYNKVFGADADRHIKEYRVAANMNNQSEEGTEAFLTATKDFLKKYEFGSWNMNNSVAWRIYEVTDDSKMLKKAKTMAIKSIAEESNYFNNDTLAAICFKLKEKDEAMKHAELAIELAKAADMDHGDTMLLLERIHMLE